MAFKCTLMAPHGGIFVFPVVGHAWMYLVALVIGTVISALLFGNLKEESGLSDMKYKNLKHDIFNNKYFMKKWRICVLAHLTHIRSNSNSVQNGGLS